MGKRRRRATQASMWVAAHRTCRGVTAAIRSIMRLNADPRRSATSMGTSRRSVQRVLRRRGHGASGPAPGSLFPPAVARATSKGIDSERGITWRAADSLSGAELLWGSSLHEAPPDHSTVSRTRRLIDLETHQRGLHMGVAAPRRMRASLTGKTDRRSTQRRWRPTRRCAASCGVTPARRYPDVL